MWNGQRRHKQDQYRFMVLPEHVVKDIDIICLWLDFEEISHQSIKFEDLPAIDYETSINLATDH